MPRYRPPVITGLQKERKADFPPAEVRINVVDVTRPRAKKKGVIKSLGKVEGECRNITRSARYASAN
jgi:hypothetical protein